MAALARERLENPKLSVEGENSRLVLSRPKPRQEGVGCRSSILHLRPDPHTAAHVEEDANADRRRTVRPKVDDRTGLPAVEHAEVLSREPRNETPAPIAHDRRNGDQIDTRAKTRRKRFLGSNLNPWREAEEGHANQPDGDSH
jgi:hypothetical protein